MKERVHNFRLPVFDPCNVWFVLTDSVEASRKARADIFGPWTSGELHGLVSYDEAGKFALFLKRGTIDHGLIAHEVFHLTVRTLEYCDVHVARYAGHESHAYLCGTLTDIIYRDLARWREKIKP